MQTKTVSDAAALQQALMAATPGTEILVAPGEYRGGVFVANRQGAPGKPILVRAADPKRPPRFRGGGTGLHLSQVSYLEVQDLVIEGMSDNGLNIDNGTAANPPSHHITLRNLTITDLPRGNHDAIKLSGVDQFRVERCQLARWGGSGIDMVGCHQGVIADCTFRDGGDNGVQAKGGSADIVIQRCRFENPGQRGVNLGGSTGLPFFRPLGARYEAKSLRVEGCIFVGSDAPLAFVGVDGATVRFNTLYLPRRWALRILQETTLPEFVACRSGIIEDNLIVFRSDSWFSGGVNIGPGTAPESFRFARNLWYCQDRPDRSRPQLPAPETGGIYGQDPQLTPGFTVPPQSPAAKIGAHVLRR